ncbi:MAG: NAD(+) synthase [Eubacterium sp.]|nr:NAD(+) synthase [Eubacterium sp.]
MIKAGVACPELKVADISFNTREIIRLLKKNKDLGLIAFPELCITSYTCADLFGQKKLLDEAENALAEIASESASLPGMTAVVGLPVPVGNRLYNCAALVSEGRIAALVPKSWLPAYGEFYEARWFASGKDLTGQTVSFAGQEIPFGTDLLAEDPESGAVVGLEICEDLWVPDKPGTHACLAGANIIVNPSASDELIGKQEYRNQMILAQSGACWCSYLYSSAGTGESSTDLVFSGHCLIAQDGNMLTESIFPEKGSITAAIIDPERSMHSRMRQTTYQNTGSERYRRIKVSINSLENSYRMGEHTSNKAEELNPDALACILKKEGYPVARNPFVPSGDQEREERCRRILQIQANGLASRVRATGIHSLVIGISGGLDSTLALLVACEARKLVPEIKITAVTMPKEGNTSGRTYHNALKLMEACSADEIREIPIGSEVRLHLADIGHAEEYTGAGDTAYENAQARIRTLILMNLANMSGGLVVGTGDLSELALGWCTYNGDHMSMYAVNASVPKTLVRYICRTYADFCGNEILKETLYDILDTPVTPELTPMKNGRIAQKTESLIGNYDLNDFFLYYHLRFGFEPEKILALAETAYTEAGESELRKAEIRFYKRFFSQQFKRSCLPDGPKVGSVTLSPRGDWRMPSDASVKLWLDSLDKI